MGRVPADLTTLVVPIEVLDDTGSMLRERGLLGLEAVVLWIGTVTEEGRAEIRYAVRPGQIAYRDEAGGCAVEVPPEALSEVISTLPNNHFVLARVHTHPEQAYHSPVDDTNMLISHEGAVSIVVPYFARDALDLMTCSVNILSHATGWSELSQDAVALRFEVR